MFELLKLNLNIILCYNSQQAGLSNLTILRRLIGFTFRNGSYLSSLRYRTPSVASLIGMRMQCTTDLSSGDSESTCSVTAANSTVADSDIFLSPTTCWRRLGKPEYREKIKRKVTALSSTTINEKKDRRVVFIMERAFDLLPLRL